MAASIIAMAAALGLFGGAAAQADIRAPAENARPSPQDMSSANAAFECRNYGSSMYLEGLVVTRSESRDEGFDSDYHYDPSPLTVFGHRPVFARRHLKITENLQADTDVIDARLVSLIQADPLLVTMALQQMFDQRCQLTAGACEIQVAPDRRLSIRAHRNGGGTEITCHRRTEV